MFESLSLLHKRNVYNNPKKNTQLKEIHVGNTKMFF